MIGYAKTPTGWVRVEIEDDVVQSMNFVGYMETNAVRSDIPEALSKLCSGKYSQFPWRFVKTVGTNFQKLIWQELVNIPRGETRTYGDIAGSVGDRKWARSVGWACGSNQIAYAIPCHRVISDKGIGGYRWGLKRKRRLLEWEAQQSSETFISSYWAL